MSVFIDKVGVLDRIKAHYSLRTSSELASFLGVAPTTISSWYTRKTFDIDILYSKCVDVNFDWLLSGRNLGREEMCLAEKKITPSKNGQEDGQANGQVDNGKEAESAILSSVIDRLLSKIDEKDKKIEEKDAVIAEQSRNIGALQKEVEMLQKGFRAKGMDSIVSDNVEVAEHANAQQ